VNNWQEGKLLDLALKFAMGPFGSNIKAENFTHEGVPVIRGKNLNSSRFVDGKFVYLTEDKADQLKSSNCYPGDIVITHRGTLGQVCLIPFSKYKRYVISQSGMKVTPNPKLLSSEFLLYFFKSRIGRHELLQNESQVGVPSISNPLTSLKSVVLNLPPIEEQKSIAIILSSLDDKIDLLHRQNKTLEAMAETLFRQWFVENEAEGCPITELVEFNPVRKLSKGSIAPYLEMAALSTRTFNPNNWYDRVFSSGTKFINGDTLLARITPCLENGKTAYVTFLEDDQVAWGSTEYIVIRPHNNLHPFFGYVLARNQVFREYAEGCMAGSSGRQRVDINHLKKFDIGIVSSDVINQFNEMAETVVPKLHANMMQIKTLENLRDSLLPKLMSGEVRLR